MNMKIYCTSDTHFGHDRLIQFGRPEGFTELELNRLRKLEGDLLIHCGDFCIGNDEVWMEQFREAASGFKKIVLVRGNHDGKSDFWYMARGFDMVVQSMSLKMFGKHILFTHIPAGKTSLLAGHHEPYDFNVHGHLHGNTHREDHRTAADYDPAFHKDLAPELHNYSPVPLNVILGV